MEEDDDDDDDDDDAEKICKSCSRYVKCQQVKCINCDGKYFCTVFLVNIVDRRVELLNVEGYGKEEVEDWLRYYFFFLANWLGLGTSNVVVRKDVILSFRQLHSCYESTHQLSVLDYLNEFRMFHLVSFFSHTRYAVLIICVNRMCYVKVIST